MHGRDNEDMAVHVMFWFALLLRLLPVCQLDYIKKKPKKNTGPISMTLTQLCPEMKPLKFQVDTNERMDVEIICIALLQNEGLFAAWPDGT